MRKRLGKGVLLFAVIGFCLAMITSCDSSKKNTASDSGPEKEKAYTIGYCTMGYSIAPWVLFLGDNLKAECEKRGWKFNMLSAEGDSELQAEQIQTMISKKPDLILIFAGDASLCVDWVKDIDAAGIHSVLVGMDVKEEGRKYATAFVGPDQEQMTYNVASGIIKEYGPDAGLTIAQIGGVPQQYDYIVRVKGFNEACKNTNYTLIEPEWAHSNRADAQGKMENLLATYGDKIDILMGYDDDLTLGAVAAIEEAGLTGDIKVYSITGMVEALHAIEEGRMVMTVQNSTAEIARVCGNVMDKILAGESVEYNNPSELFYITKENVADYKGEF